MHTKIDTILQAGLGGGVLCMLHKDKVLQAVRVAERAEMGGIF